MSRAVVVATGVTANGTARVLGVAVGESENGAFWTGFLQGLRARGLTGVQLVIRDEPGLVVDFDDGIVGVPDRVGPVALQLAEVEAGRVEAG